MQRLKSMCLAAIVASVAGSPAHAGDFEVMTFWTAPSEAKALAVVRNAFVADGHSWLQRDFADGSLLRRESTNQFITGTPSAATQWVFGQSLSELSDTGMMTPIGNLVPTEMWPESLPPFVFRSISVGDQIYLAPIGVHIENMMWMNRAVLDENGLSVPGTWAELVAAGRVLQARGITPIVLPVDDWARQIIIRAVIADAAGRHEALRVPNLTWEALIDHPAIEEIVRTLVALGDLVTPTTVSLKWTEAARMLAEGRAGFYFMGDWVRGEFIATGHSVDKDIVCAVPPGNRWVQSLVIDGFFFPVLDDPDLVAAQSRMVDILMDPKVQLDFALIKGSVPVRRDVDYDRLDSCAADAHARMSDPTVAFHRVEPNSPDWNGNVRFIVALLDALADPGLDAESVLMGLRAIRKESPNR